MHILRIPSTNAIIDSLSTDKYNNVIHTCVSQQLLSSTNHYHRRLRKALMTVTIIIISFSQTIATHYICLLREHSIVETLHSHPSDWLLHRSLSILSLSPLSEVVPGIDVL